MFTVFVKHLLVSCARHFSNFFYSLHDCLDWRRLGYKKNQIKLVPIVSQYHPRLCLKMLYARTKYREGYHRLAQELVLLMFAVCPKLLISFPYQMTSTALFVEVKSNDACVSSEYEQLNEAVPSSEDDSEIYS